jgi:hypothetical protein
MPPVRSPIRPIPSRPLPVKKDDDTFKKLRDMSK